jgi:LuxR family maltose regulon positive regulatory protein
MALRLLSTKFHVPPWRPGYVQRRRLVERLQAGWAQRARLTLVCAPAGYGKSTAVVEWLQTLDQGTPAWLSLDPGDNDPVRCLGHLMAAGAPGHQPSDAVAGLLSLPHLPPLTAIIDTWINEVSGLKHPLVLVLDDVHVLTNPDLITALAYLVDHQPERLRLVMTSREDPALPLARMRARGQLTEIRAHDLRFTRDETRALFHTGLQLDLDADAIRMLESRTEGWAVGLHLAGLALQHSTDRPGFVRRFGGSHRYIIDYLSAEVIHQQPPEVRNLLVWTCLLPRFNGALCEAVTGDPRSAERLSALERANVFLVPLDEQRGWYRYHTLFADVLRVNVPAEVAAESRRLAAHWYESAGLQAEAIDTWLAVPDPEQAADAIRRAAPETLRVGELQTLLHWLEALPDASILHDPDLMAYRALARLLTGRLHAAQLEPALEDVSGTVSGRAYALQAWMAMLTGRAESGPLAQVALHHLADADRFFRAITLIALGDHHAWQARLPKAGQVFQQAHELARQLEHPFLSLGATTQLAYNWWEMGRLRDAEALCRQTLTEFSDPNGHPLPIAGMLFSPLATICFDRGAYGEANELAQRSITQSERLFSKLVLGGDSEISLARVAFQRGDPLQAITILETAAATARQHGGHLVAIKMAIALADLHLLQGDTRTASWHLHSVSDQVPAEQAKTQQVLAHLWARLWAATGQSERALTILAGLAADSEAEGSVRRLISLRVTQALITQQLGDLTQANAYFQTALRLAAPEGCLSPFLPHPGRLTRPLLQRARATAPDLVGAALEETALGALAPGPGRDPLTDQELRVLRLVIAGKSNQAIAAELVISLGTAKWHVHNILQKLGVRNRPEAIARARDLGL